MSTVLLSPSRSAQTEQGETEQSELAARGRDGTQVRLRSRLYLPAFSIAALAVLLIALGWSVHWGGTNFTGSVTLLRVVLVGPLALMILGCFMVVERIWPAQRRPLVARGHRHDLMLTIMNAILVAPLVTALTLSFVALVQRDLPWIVLPRISALPRWGAIIAILVVMDFCNWAVHLANHRVRLMWRFHELHHSQEDMNVLTVFRTHPLIHVSYLLALIPGVVLLANGALSVTVLVLYGGMVAFAHSNTRARLRASGAGLREPELPPDPPQVGWAAGRQPRLRTDHLGSVVPPGGLPDGRDGQDRHRAAWSPAHRRTGIGATTPLLGPPRPIGGALPPRRELSPQTTGAPAAAVPEDRRSELQRPRTLGRS